MELKSQPQVISVSLSDKGGIPKYPQKFIEVYEFGVKGDYHSGISNFHANKNNLNRQITIISKEVVDDINSQINNKILKGSLGENILVEGLGDLSNIKDGQILKFGKYVTLKVTGQNQPCATLNSIDERILKLIVRKRGLLATVISTGKIFPLDNISLLNEKSK